VWCEEQRALPACEKPPAWRVDVYYHAKSEFIEVFDLEVKFLLRKSEIAFRQ
jgi:hypothetical protein